MPRGAVIALGMGAELPNRLPDGSITASSEWIHDQTGEEGRSDETGRALDARMPDSKKTFHEWYMLPAWTPRHDECHSTLDGEWLQIAFARPVELVAVETQGKYGGGGWGVVHSYDVRTSDDGFAWELRATLEGCRTQNLERRRAELPSPVVTRFVRIYPRQYWHRPSMRLELYGRSTPEPTAAVGGKVHPAADASYDDDEAIARALQDEEDAAAAEPQGDYVWVVDGCNEHHARIVASREDGHVLVRWSSHGTARTDKWVSESSVRADNAPRSSRRAHDSTAAASAPPRGASLPDQMKSCPMVPNLTMEGDATNSPAPAPAQATKPTPFRNPLLPPPVAEAPVVAATGAT